VRHPDGPEAEELRPERRGGVACAAERAGGCDLDAVDELKARGYEQQRNGGGDNDRIRREDMGHAAGDCQKDH